MSTQDVISSSFLLYSRLQHHWKLCLCLCHRIFKVFIRFSSPISGFRSPSQSVVINIHQEDQKTMWFSPKAAHDADDVFGFIGKYKICCCFFTHDLCTGKFKRSFLFWTIFWLFWSCRSTVCPVFCLFSLHALHRLIGQLL